MRCLCHASTARGFQTIPRDVHLWSGMVHTDFREVPYDIIRYSYKHVYNATRRFKQFWGVPWTCTDHTFRPYIYVLYGVYIRRLKFTYSVYENGYGENLFIHTFIYGTYIYGVYILIRFGPTLGIW